MYRIRFHGRGGQGMKTASRILGTAFFIEGYDVQDAPRYGAERRGAPMFAYVRVSRHTINERGPVKRPDLVVCADKSLLTLPSSGVLTDATPQTILLAEASHNTDTTAQISGFNGTYLTINPGSGTSLSSFWSGAAARLCGIISKQSLEQAVVDELQHLPQEALEKNLETALAGWNLMNDYSGIVREGGDTPPMNTEAPIWLDIKSDSVFRAAPAIRIPQTSRTMKTGLWRTERPVIDSSKCRKCWWNCCSYCPDSAMTLSREGFPVIDYAYCKGCLVCAQACPSKAIAVLPEGRGSDSVKGG